MWSDASAGGARTAGELVLIAWMVGWNVPAEMQRGQRFSRMGREYCSRVACDQTNDDWPAPGSDETRSALSERPTTERNRWGTVPPMTHGM